jgi:hypothetical protein
VYTGPIRIPVGVWPPTPVNDTTVPPSSHRNRIVPTGDPAIGEARAVPLLVLERLRHERLEPRDDERPIRGDHRPHRAADRSRRRDAAQAKRALANNEPHGITASGCPVFGECGGKGRRTKHSGQRRTGQILEHDVDRLGDIGLRQDQGVRRRSHRRGNDSIAIDDDAEVRRLRIDRRVAEHRRADSQDQVVLGLARREEPAGQPEERSHRTEPP